MNEGRVEKAEGDRDVNRPAETLVGGFLEDGHHVHEVEAGALREAEEWEKGSKRRGI